MNSNLKFPTGSDSGYLLSDRFERRYFSGIDVAEGIVLKADKSYYFADSRYFYALREKLEGTPITAVRYTGLDCVAEILKENGIKRLGLDFEHTTLAEYKEYKKLNVKLFDCAETLKKMRSVKSDSETESIKNACSVTQKAVNALIPFIKEGVTENFLKSKLTELMRGFGADGTAFDTIVAFGANSAVPHHESGETALCRNSVVLIDAGATVDGYCSDMTRTFFYGEPDEKFLSAYRAVKEANEYAEANTADGTSFRQAFGYAVSVLDKYGIGKYFTHSLGHGLGLEIHEYPVISASRTGRLKENTVFTIEPGVYFDGEFGIRIEDTVMIKNGRTVRLFNDSKELVIIDGHK